MNCEKYIALLTALVILCTFSACQQTPEKEAVIQRDNTEKVVLESSEQEESNKVTEEIRKIPETIQSRFEVVEDYMDIVINAPINFPYIDNISVVKVKPITFSINQAEIIKEYFAKDGELQEHIELTQSEYDDMIIEAKRGQLIDGVYVVNESSEAWVEELIKRRDEAPDARNPQPISEYSIEDGIHANITINGKKLGSVHFSENIISFSAGLKTASKSMPIIVHRAGERPVAEYLPDVQIDMFEAEAINIGKKILDDLDIQGMNIKEIEEVVFFEDNVEDATSGGYKMVFMRESSGIMPVYMTGYGRNTQEPLMEYTQPAEMESLIITINDSGEVTFFSWRNPIEIVEVLSNDVPIISFDEILTRLEDFSKYQWSYLDDMVKSESYKSVKYIYDINLNLSYLPIKNNPTEFMYVPCWVFTYKPDQFDTMDLERMDTEGIYPDLSEVSLAYSDEYIIFSAIDGASVSAYPAKILEPIK